MAFYGNKFRELLNSLLKAHNQTKSGKRLGSKFTITADPNLIHEIHSNPDFDRSAITRRMVAFYGADKFLVAQKTERSSLKRKELSFILNTKTYKKILNVSQAYLEQLLYNSINEERCDLYYCIRNSLQIGLLEEYLGIEYLNKDVQRAVQEVGFSINANADEPFEKLFILNFLPLPHSIKCLFSPLLKERNEKFDKVVKIIYEKAAVKQDGWLFRLKLLEKQNILSRREVLGEIRGVFINADTLATSLVWSVYRLSIENRYHLNHVIGSTSYARLCFMECLRLYPPFQLMGYEKKSRCPFHRNETFIVSAIAAHRNPKYWENPDSFNPLRFEKGMSKIVKGSFIPFGGGERACPAIGMTMNIAPILLTNIFRKFRFTNIKLPNVKDVRIQISENNTFFAKVNAV